MSCTLSLEAECLRLRLRAGAELVCRGGSLWLTFEARDRPSPDILLAPGERYRLHGDAEVFLAALRAPAPRCARSKRRRTRVAPAVLGSGGSGGCGARG